MTNLDYAAQIGPTTDDLQGQAVDERCGTRTGLTNVLKPIPRPRVSEEVARRIQDLIASRSLKKGDRLPTERELTESLGVGRGAVREGLRYLAAYDIVSVRQGSGTFVNEVQRLALLQADSLDSEERRNRLRLATEARRTLDCAAVEAAVRHGEPTLVQDLRKCLEDADSEPKKTHLAHAIDLTFEQVIGDHCGNLYLVALQREAHGYFRSAWEGVGLMPRPAGERSAQHWGIFEAVERADADEARQRMTEHFRLQALAPQKF